MEVDGAVAGAAANMAVAVDFFWRLTKQNSSKPLLSWVGAGRWWDSSLES